MHWVILTHFYNALMFANNTHITKISCAVSKSDLCAIRVLVQIAICVPLVWTANAVASLRQQPWHINIFVIISELYQCVEKCSQGVVIKFNNTFFASLPRKKERVNSFCVLLHGNMIKVALCHADFPRFRQSTGKHLSRSNSRTASDWPTRPWIKSPIAWQSHILQCYRRSMCPVSLQIKYKEVIKSTGIDFVNLFEPFYASSSAEFSQYQIVVVTSKDKDKDKEALFNVAYNVTDNISS